MDTNGDENNKEHINDNDRNIKKNWNNKNNEDTDQIEDGMIRKNNEKYK